MYCTKCGKQIDYDTPICLECTAVLAIKAKQAREAAKAAEANSAPIVNPVSIANPAQQAQSAPSCVEAQSAERTAQSEPTPSPMATPSPQSDACQSEEVVAQSTPSCVEAQSAECTAQSELTPSPAQQSEACCSEESTAQSEYASAMEEPAVAPASVVYPYETVVIPENKPKTRMKGFGAALASTILATIAMVILGLGYALLLADIKLIGLIVIAIFFAMMVVSLVLGIKSILTFKSVVRAKNPAPIATLVLGIYSLVMSVEGFVMGISYVADGLNILDYFHFT